jgi:hypothetical protein
MAAQPVIQRIPMQLGTELRIKKSGEIAISNPVIEEPEEATAEAVLSYRFDPATGDHIIGLVQPLAAKIKP